MGPHEPHVFRINGGKPFAVRDVEQAADRVFDAVRGGAARAADGDARERASQRHPFPRFEIGGVGLYLGQAFMQPEDCLTRIQLLNGLARTERNDSMAWASASKPGPAMPRLESVVMSSGSTMLSLGYKAGRANPFFT